MIDPVELNYQYRRYRADTDSHFGGGGWDEDEFDDWSDDEFDDVDPEEDDSMAVLADYADAADHLRRFIIRSAKNQGIPASEWDEVAGDAILEIAEELGNQQLSMLLESIDASDRIVDAFRESQRGLAARRAIKRSLKRFRFPQATCTDIGLNDEVDHGS